MALPTGVTYFPYIRIPPDAFMTRLLLYWDDVATIVPDQWAYATEEVHRRKLGDFTYELVEAGLVTMAVPQYDLGGALAPFEAHFDDLPGSVMDERIARFEDGEHFKLHKGKLPTSVSYRYWKNDALRYARTRLLASHGTGCLWNPKQRVSSWPSSRRWSPTRP